MCSSSALAWLSEFSTLAPAQNPNNRRENSHAASSSIAYSLIATSSRNAVQKLICAIKCVASRKYKSHRGLGVVAEITLAIMS